MSNTSRTETLRAGEYYFGDICYIMNEEVYHKVWGDKLGFKDGLFHVDFRDSQGRQWLGDFVVSGTAYGDGCYEGKHRNYGVDAGVLGLVPISLWDPEKAKDIKRLGARFVARSRVAFEVKDGWFTVDSENFHECVDTDPKQEEDDRKED